MKKSKLLLLVLSFVVGGTQAQTWSLQKCIEYALENNLTIKQSQLNVSLSEGNLTQSKYDILPNLNASASQSYNFGKTINTITNTYVNQQVSSNVFNLNTSVTLFNGLQKINTYQQNKYDLEAEKNNLEKIRNDIALTVINYYLNALYNEDLLNVSKAQLLLSEEQLSRALKNAEVGNLTEGDVLQIKSQVATDELNVTNAQNQLDIAKLNLIQLLDRDPAEKFEVERPQNLDMVGSINTNYSLQQVYSQAIQTLPDVKLMEFRSKAAQKGLSAARGGLFPRLTLGAGIGTDYTDINPVSFNRQIDNNLGKYASFSLNVPIFNGFSARTNVKRAKINSVNAEINEQLAKNTLSKIIAQAIADLKAAGKKYESTFNSYESLKEAFKYNQQKFDVGLINSVDYNLSKNNLSKAEIDLLQARYDLIFKGKILDFYMGKSLSF